MDFLNEFNKIMDESAYFSVLFLLSFLLLLPLLLFNIIFIRRIRKEEEKKRNLQLQHKKKVLKTSIVTQEKERKRIASDLHDHLIAQLHRAKLINRNTAVNEVLSESIAVARHISHDLSPPLLTQTSVKELFVDFLKPFQEKYINNYLVSFKQRRIY
ncbi:MAG: hypothetical protein GKR88_07120 [Flavobacteriaceae bacterium]|nr:MAG: hypothetical protein GKR88_07120 [Flavobacteriaceae bacterium]